MNRCTDPAQRGFTLLEMLVTISIAVILFAVAVPGFDSYRRTLQLGEAVSNMVTATSAARAAALKTGTNTVLAATDARLGWSSGWFVFVDRNGNGRFDEEIDEVVGRYSAPAPDIQPLPSGTSASSASNVFAAPAVIFSGGGFPKAADGAWGSGILVLAGGSRSRSVLMDTSGRMRSCRTGEAGCPGS